MRKRDIINSSLSIVFLFSLHKHVYICVLESMYSHVHHISFHEIFNRENPKEWVEKTVSVHFSA